jgi:hypothetical protein
MSEWQPIETAPKDGRPVFLWADGSAVEVWAWNEKNSRWETSDDGVFWREGAEYGPTHWLPYPEPPALNLAHREQS